MDSLLNYFLLMMNMAAHSLLLSRILVVAVLRDHNNILYLVIDIRLLLVYSDLFLLFHLFGLALLGLYF